MSLEQVDPDVGLDGPDSAAARRSADWARTILSFHGAIRRFIARRAPWQEVDDLLSEVMVNLLNRRAEAPIDNARSYVFASAANTIRRRRRPPVAPPPDDEHIVDVLSPERRLIAKESLQIVERAIEGLSPRCRDAFVLHRYQHMTYAEIAQTMNISVKMVEKHVAKALDRIGAALEAQP